MHDGASGERLTPDVLKGLPTFKHVGHHGNAHTIYGSVGPSGETVIQGSLGFTGKLTKINDKEAPFFVRVEVVDALVPTFGDSPEFVVHARKKHGEEIPNREVMLGLRPREESEGEGEGEGEGVDGTAAPAPKKKKKAAPAKKKAPPAPAAPAAAPEVDQTSVLARMPKRARMGGVPAVLDRMELPRSIMPVRSEAASLGRVVDEAFAAVEGAPATQSEEMACTAAEQPTPPLLLRLPVPP